MATQKNECATRWTVGLLRRWLSGHYARVYRMSTASLVSSEKPAAPAASVDFSRPVVRPKKGFFKLVGEVLDHGGPGYLQFAITNICNADCDFCGFARSKFDPKARRSVTLKEEQAVIDI